MYYGARGVPTLTRDKLDSLAIRKWPKANGLTPNRALARNQKRTSTEARFGNMSVYLSFSTSATKGKNRLSFIELVTKSTRTATAKVKIRLSRLSLTKNSLVINKIPEPRKRSG